MRRLSSFLPLLFLALITGGCAKAQPQVQRFDDEIVKRSLSTIGIVDTLDDTRTIAHAHRGDTVYVIGTVTNKGWKSNRYLARYRGMVGMLTTDDGLVDAGRWPESSASHATSGDSTTSTGGTAGRETVSGGGTTGGDGHVIHTGPRGGQYYINSSGKKVYVKRK